jgi:hypothetical protein
VLTLVAGLSDETAASGPGVVTLTNPRAFAIEASGDLLVVDNGVLVRVKPGGNPVPVAAGLFKEGATTFTPSAVFTGASGGAFVIANEDLDNFYFVKKRDAVFQLGADDVPALVFRAIGPSSSGAPGLDGSLLVADTKISTSGADMRGQVALISPQGVVEPVLASAQKHANVVAWWDGPLAVYGLPIYEADKPMRYTPHRVEPDGTTTVLPAVDGPPALRDAEGRAYAGGTTITRTDAAGAKVVIAGPGGKIFNGSGVDDGIGKATALLFGPEGDLYFLDLPNRQIKRIPNEQL